jgi:hypothetical protein
MRMAQAKYAKRPKNGMRRLRSIMSALAQNRSHGTFEDTMSPAGVFHPSRRWATKSPMIAVPV